MNPIFDFDVKGQSFNIKLYPNELKNNLYKYKYYNTIEKKKLKIMKYFLHSLYLNVMVLHL